MNSFMSIFLKKGKARECSFILVKDILCNSYIVTDCELFSGAAQNELSYTLQTFLIH